MQHVVDYIRQNAATYSREMIDAQLRQVGHSEAAIQQAWSAAFGAPAAGASAGVAVMAGGPTGPDTTAGGGSWHRSPNARIVMVLIAIVATISSGYGAYHEWTDGPAEITTKQLLDKMDEQDTDGSLEALSGDVDGALPKGWKRVKDGLWADMSTGNSVNVMTTSRDGLTLEQITMAAVETLKLQGSSPKQKVVEFQGRDAHRIQVSQATPQGAKMLVTQYYVAHGTDMTIVTMGYEASASDEVKSAVHAVANQVELPA